MGEFKAKVRRFVLNNLLHASDTPHVIAKGVALAVFVAFLPLVGIQTFVALGLAALTRANKAVCIPIVWITNPATIVPIYYLCWLVGRLVLPKSMQTTTEDDVAAFFLFMRESSLLTAEFWSNVGGFLLGIGWELWVGSIIVGVIFSVPCYFLTRWVISAYRERRRKRRLERQMFRARFRKARVIRPTESA